MFNKNFYPTPPKAINLMIEPYGKAIFSRGVNILDPSAGKGDILQRFGTYRSDRPNLYCIEIEHELLAILAQIEGCKIIGTDFLQYTGGHHFDYILMNPPFDAGAKHLLHAWDVLQYGEICCLLNAETINNTFSRDRELLERLIKDQNGTVENLGAVFATAERKTNVNTSMVRLSKKQTKTMFDFSDLNLDKSTANLGVESDLNDQSPAKLDKINNAVLCHSECVKAAQQVADGIAKLNYYGGGVGLYLDRMLKELADFRNGVCGSSYSKGKNGGSILNMLLDCLNNDAWSNIFNNTGIASRITGDFKKQFDIYRQVQCGSSFTRNNILAMMEFVMNSQSGIFETAIGNLFDKITSHSPKDNVLHLDGWKTNSHYKVNRKMILPNWGSNSNKYRFLTDFRQSFTDLADDFDKALCWIKGIDFNTIKSISATAKDHYWNNDNYYNEEVESTFFKIKMFKKGTIHLTFLDEWLWTEFNRIAAKNKNWLTDETEKPKSKKK